MQFAKILLGLCFATILLAPVAMAALLMHLFAALVNGLSRWLSRKPDVSRWRQIVQYEPEIGWRPQPEMSVYAQADDVYHITTGADGWRGTLPIEDADIVVFGDSFAFGHGVDDDRMYTRRCGDLKVKPIGSDGYQMVHGLLWMRRLEEQLKGRMVVWFVYYGNDLHENLMPSTNRYRMPHLRSSGPDAWDIVTEHVSPEPWLFPHSSSYREYVADYSSDTDFSERVFSGCEFLIRSAAQICHRAGATLTVFGIPDRFQLTADGISTLKRLSSDPDSFRIDKPDRTLAEICRANGALFVSLRDHLQPKHYLSADIHWNDSGHRKIGSLLEQLYLEQRNESALDAPVPLSRHASGHT